MFELFATGDGDFFQRLDAIDRESRGDDGHPLDPLARQRHQRRIGIGLEPLRRAEPALEGDLELVLRPAQVLAHQPRRLQALAVVGVARLEILHRHTVVRGEDHVGGEIQRRHAVGDALRQRLDIGRLIEIGGKRAHRRLPAQRLQRVERLVVGRGRGGCRILRIERREENLLAAGRLQRLDARPGRRIAVTHGEIDDDVPAQPLLQLGRLLAGNDAQRAVIGVLVPDAGIVLAALLRPGTEHHALQDRLPQPLRGLDHPGVRQEFAEIAAHCPVVGAIGSAQVEQQHPHFRRRDRGVSGGKSGCHGLACSLETFCWRAT